MNLTLQSIHSTPVREGSGVKNIVPSSLVICSVVPILIGDYSISTLSNKPSNTTASSQLTSGI